MGFLGIVLVVIFVAVSILLVGVVLLQDEQGEGLGGIFGGGSATPFGSRSGNILTRFTTILGAIFLFCAFGIAWVNRSTQSGDVLAAAKKAQASQSSEWWNASVNSNEAVPTTGQTGSTASAPAAVAAPTSTAAPAGTSTAPAQPNAAANDTKGSQAAPASTGN
ncbi:MAG TPA: preprotein translocase subunit SecG [Spirochaetia bacterium]|nr:preprotein translocase subunit SecG [Spirochaetia bacterium]